MKIITNLSALVTLISFLFPFIGSKPEPLSNWQYFFIFLTFVSLLVLITWEILSRPKKYKNDSEINSYMCKWISKTGRALVFTRDMSWANENDVKSVLFSKAKNKELIICMPEKSILAKELEDSGAEVIEYPNLNYQPKSRFTIIHYGRSDSKMAIGRTDSKGHHFIQEFENGMHTQFHLAEDLVQVLKEIRKHERIS